MDIERIKTIINEDRKYTPHQIEVLTSGLLTANHIYHMIRNWYVQSFKEKRYWITWPEITRVLWKEVLNFLSKKNEWN